MVSKIYQLKEAGSCIYPACNLCNQCKEEEISTDIDFCIINKKEFDGLPKNQMINLGVNILISDLTDTLFFIYEMNLGFYLVI